MHKTNTFELKGSLFTLTVLKLKSVDLVTIKQELAATLASAPKFFENAPVVIDLQLLAQINPDCDFTALSNILRENHLIPIGVRNGSEQHHQAAISAGLALLPNIKIQETTSFTEQPAEAVAPKAKAEPKPVVEAEVEEQQLLSGSPTKIITQPVRSGKQVYVKGGDLLILSSVSHGAEVLADGTIHVYGTLRGRALAGVRGDKNARIFCQDLDAELISIAGHYKTSDEIQNPLKGEKGLIHIYLEEDELKIEAI
jgi:septum site-determining protein MinC